MATSTQSATPGQMRTLRAAARLGGPDGWIIGWPAGVSNLAIDQCHRLGWLEQQVNQHIQYAIYRLTDAGRVVERRRHRR